MPYTEVPAALLHGLGLMALIAMCYGVVERTVTGGSCRGWLEGIVFGAGAIGAMVSPAIIANGVIVDARCVIIGIGAAFAGWRAALSAVVMAVSYRAWLGGVGAPVGMVSIATSAIIGLGWGYLYAAGRRAGIVQLGSLGVALASHVVGFFFLPIEDPVGLALSTAPMIVPAYLVAVLIMGSMMQRETRAIERESTLATEALTDPLTGLANRRAYRAVIGDLFADLPRNPASFSLLVVDIDHFKRVNDTHGHETGDDVLKIVSRTMRAGLKPDDFLFRCGGEEFCLILLDTDSRSARHVAEEVCEAVRAIRLVIDGQPLALSVSIGCAVASSRSRSAAALYAEADAALYAAKRRGRDRVAFASDAEQPFARCEPPASDPAESFTTAGVQALPRLAMKGR